MATLNVSGKQKLVPKKFLNIVDAERWIEKDRKAKRLSPTERKNLKRALIYQKECSAISKTPEGRYILENFKGMFPVAVKRVFTRDHGSYEVFEFENGRELRCSVRALQPCFPIKTQTRII